MSEATMQLPELWSQSFVVDGNACRQMIRPAELAALEQDGSVWRAVLNDGTRVPVRARGETPHGTEGLEASRQAVRELPQAVGDGSLRWVTGRRPLPPSDVLQTLRGAIDLAVEPGLRVPQAGAVHAALAHWSTGTTEPATIVMPTGTGKTDTMIALAASQRLERILVLVPSDNLRKQIASAFERWGVLGSAGVISAKVAAPAVGRIEHRLDSVGAARSLANACNVMVTTPSALNASTDEVLTALAGRCSHLFVDEAHHVAAASWRRVRDAFESKPVLQFTATPYRTDGERLGGRLIYSFPLRRAQQLGYFQKIKYVSVVALADPDRAVAEEAVERLRSDLASGLDHLIMARVNRIGRARDDVLPIYEEIAADLQPQVLHSDLSAADRRAALAAITTRSSRIIVCVDMLGEGFDFPELKVAAFHDPHRSLGVALQFIGRFARSRNDLGTATAVVARPDPGYDPRLRSLYAEDPEWDTVIEALTAQAIEDVQELDEFESGFTGQDRGDLSLQVLRPKMSTVVYRTGSVEWRPEALAELFHTEQIIAAPSVNSDEHVVWLVVEDRRSVRWAETHSVEDLAHHLHVLHWDRARQLLYINSSDLDSLHIDLARAVCGEDVQRIAGDNVYRALAHLQRAVPTNVGVIDVRNRSRRFSMHVGADVYEGFSVAEQQTKSNTNIFLVGYEDGKRVTRGAAAKGRIWSQQSAPSIHHWVQWVRDIGPRLQDEQVSLDALFRSFVRPRPLETRPPLFPLAIDWPWLPFSGMSEATRLRVPGLDEPIHLIDAELALVDHSDSGPITFELRVEDTTMTYEALVQDGALTHRPLAIDAEVLHDRKDPEPLSSYLNREGSTIWFDHEVVIEGPGLLLELDRDRPPVDLDLLIELDWSGVTITRESQGPERDPATVQARAAERLIDLRDWDVVVDDDGRGEVADLVALKEEDQEIIVHLVHCKYSATLTPGARLGDLYEVCGQAHRSAHLRQNLDGMIKTLVRRERRRRAKGVTGIMIGQDDDLLRFQDVVHIRRPRMHVTLAQPGFSKAQGERRHLEVLGCADTYVKEIAHASFDVWCSP